MGMKKFTTPHGIFRWRIMECDPTKGIAFTKIQSAKPCLANLGGVLKDRGENRVEVARRGTNNLEHVGGSGLLLQRFRKIPRARLHLIEQSHVLDRDDCLVGKCFSKFDLFVGKWLDDATLQKQDTNRRSFAQ